MALKKLKTAWFPFRLFRRVNSAFLLWSSGRSYQSESSSSELTEKKNSFVPDKTQIDCAGVPARKLSFCRKPVLAALVGRLSEFHASGRLLLLQELFDRNDSMWCSQCCSAVFEMISFSGQFRIKCREAACYSGCIVSNKLNCKMSFN